jgi:fermentation-respiration switch protein FrsA (DUF1100 family)
MLRKSIFVFMITLAITGCLASLENTLLYQPAPGAKTYEPPPAPLQDLELTMEDGTRIHVRWVPNPKAAGAVLYCHGNAGNIERCGDIVHEIYENLGESVLIVDYPGYGYSRGTPSEQGCDAAAQTAYGWLTQTQKVPGGRIVLMGESVGGGVAIDLATRVDHRALVLVRTFTSVADVADDQFPLLFSAPLVTNHFDNLQKIALCKQPIFIAQADKDRTIPFRHGQRLAQAASDRAQLYVLRGLGHNDPLPADFYAALRQFLSKVPPR